jgi:hypothetical protein
MSEVSAIAAVLWMVVFPLTLGLGFLSVVRWG